MSYYASYEYRLSKWEQFLVFLGGLLVIYFFSVDTHFFMVEDFDSWNDAIKRGDPTLGKYRNENGRIVLDSDNKSNYGWGAVIGIYVICAAFNFYVSNW